MSLSVVILTHNNQNSIERCLKSASFADEIIVVDDFSTDKTIPVAKKHHPKILKRKLSNDYAAQRNHGLNQATSDWVLFLDSDEIITPALRAEILANISQKSITGFYLKRTDFLLGSTLEHGEIGNTRLLRLAQKGAGRWIRPVHEYWQVNGPTKTLKNPLHHLRDLSLSQFIARINHYTDLDAKALLAEDKPFTYHDLFIKPVGKFLYNYFYLLGFLDGFAGFTLAFSMSLHSLIVRVKLYELIKT